MKVRERRRSSSITLTDEVIDIEGAAHLCFSANGDWFQGHLVSAEQSTYSISGIRVNPSNATIQETPSDEWFVNNALNPDDPSVMDKTNHNELSSEEDIYEVVVIDHEQGTRYTFDEVPRKSDVKCLLKSKKFVFESETVYKGQRADMVIQNFLPRLVGQNLNVHAGRLTITVHKRPEPLIKWTM